MQETILFILAVFIGLIILTWSADRFITGASGVAQSFSISPMIIGLTIVAFGTSAPEMLVSAIASFQGNEGIGVGNAIGSNVTNIALVLGVAALILPLKVHSQTLNRELPLLVFVMFVALALLWDETFTRIDGFILLIGLIVLVLWTIHLARIAPEGDSLQDEFLNEMPNISSRKTIWWLLISGLVLLLISSQMLVWGAVGIAKILGVSDLVIGLTIVAIGTSLPELAATIAAIKKGEHDMAISGIVGSNLFNILGVLGLAGAISPGPLDPDVLNRDFPFMIALTIALFLLARGLRRSGHGIIQRWAGGVLLFTFVAYQSWIMFSHPSLNG